MANRMLQLLVADRFATGFPDCKITGFDIAEWGLSGGPDARGARAWPKIDTGRIDTEWLLAQIAAGRIDRLRITEAICDFDALPSRARANALFDPQGEAGAPTTDDEVVIHVRLEDILVPGRHKGYGPLPLAWYRDLIENTGLRPVFIGQFGDDRYSQALRRAFPTARILAGGSVLHDFQTIRNAHNVALGVSTFSWLAAWLGARGRIFYPLLGILHPIQSPGLNLTPQADARYEFHLFPPRSWEADSAALDSVIDGPNPARCIAAAELAALLHRSQDAAAADIAAWRARMLAAMKMA